LFVIININLLRITRMYICNAYG